MSGDVIALEGVLSDVECKRLAARVDALKDAWLRRGPGFSTLGVAAYLDIMCSKDADADYYRRLEAQNRLLAENFGWLLERVRECLEQHFGRPARFEQSVALPGFHIFEAPGIIVWEQESQHFDLQYRYMRWPFSPPDDEILSFTLAIESPRLGGALDTWALTEKDLRRLERLGRRPRMGQIGRTKPLTRHEYAPGRMVIQLEPVMHRIAGIPQCFPDDRRITFQGHTVDDGQSMVLYW